MDKITYLAELAEGLARWVPERERQDILRYYAEYFDEAGPGKEAEVIAELGDPWALSCRLAVEGGYVTQDAANAWRPPQNRRKAWPFVLAGTLAAVLIIAVSVGSFMSLVGGRVGRFIGRTMDRVTAVEEVQIGDVGIIAEGGSNAVWYEYPDLDGFWSMEDGTLEYFSTIDADISLGNLYVSGGEDYTLVIQYGGSPGGYRVDWEVKNGTLKIRDGGPDGHFGLDGLGDLLEGECVDVIITVPETEHLGRLAVRTDVGSVYLSELFVEGDVSAESDTGDVECYEVQTMKKLSLASSVGDVMLGIERMYAGMEMELKSDVGQVEASLGCWEVECGYQVKTGVGTVCVNGRDCGTKAEHKADAAFCKLDVESGVGDVNVWFFNDQWNH